MATERGFTEATHPIAERSIGRSVLYGVLAGIVGGVVFGVMMMVMMPAALPMIGRIIGMENVAGGWLYHLFNSAVIGALFGLVVGVARSALTYATGALWGAVYGAIWWVLGPLVLMPLMLGMTQMVFAINNDTLMSLMGHVIFGVVTGLSFVFLKDRLTT